MYRKQLLALAGIAGIGGLFLTAPANAVTVSIGACESGCPTVTPVNSGTGNDSASGPFGTFTFNSVSGTGNPPLTGNDLFSSSSFNISSLTAGTLEVFITVSGITSPVGSALGLLSSFTTNAVPTGWTISENTYLNASNSVFGTTTALGSASFTSIGTLVSGGTFNTGSGPYSLTELYTVVATGAGEVNSTIDISNTPLPAALPLFAGGLGIMGLLARRKKKKGVTALSAIA